jgi:hypothetical protein
MSTAFARRECLAECPCESPVLKRRPTARSDRTTGISVADYVTARRRADGSARDGGGREQQGRTRKDHIRLAGNAR